MSIPQEILDKYGLPFKNAMVFQEEHNVWRPMNHEDILMYEEFFSYFIGKKVIVCNEYSTRIFNTQGVVTLKITQEIYDTALFLSRCVYYEMEGVYPKPFDKCLTYEGKFSGLKMNVFDMEEYHIIVLCGTKIGRAHV